MDSSNQMLQSSHIGSIVKADFLNRCYECYKNIREVYVCLFPGGNVIVLPDSMELKSFMILCL